MDEVARIKVELEKAYGAKNGDKATELLKLLVNIPVTMIVLQDTHIGATVNKIRKSFNHTESVSLATKVVKKWKKMAEQYKQSGGAAAAAQQNDNNSNSSSNNNIHSQHNNNSNPGSNLASNTTSADNSSNNNNGSKDRNNSLGDLNGKDTKSRQSSNHQADDKTNNSTSTSSTSSTSSSAQNQSPPGDNKSQPKPSTSGPSESEGGSVPTSKPKFIQKEVPATNSQVRLKFRQMICESLRKPLPKEMANQDPFLDEEGLAGRIEEHIYQEFKSDTDSRYRNRVRSRICNLNDQKNPYLRLNVLRGDISAERMARMTADEMASDELKRQREQFTKEAINDHQMAVTTGTSSSEIKCPACKKYDCTYNQMQTRSADEPMTTFCHCNNCGKRWKFC